MKKLLPLALTIIAARVCAGPATLSADQSAFVKWARGALTPLATVEPSTSMDDLRALGNMIGDAKLVALSEGVHAGAEPLEFRNRVLQYLVQEKGFTAIAIESGIVEGRLVHDYVRDGTGELHSALAQGISWTFDKLPQNESLVRWMREYNADARHGRKVNFYGFDMPGSPGNPQANRNTDTALIESLRYLRTVDAVAAAQFHKRLDPLLPNVRFDPTSAERPGYPKLSQAERDIVTASVAEIVTLLERREAVYVTASSQVDYEWAYRAALGARQVDQWLRQIPLSWQPSAELGSFFSAATDIRDRLQADNIDWVMRQEGASGKVLVYASRYHLSSLPLQSGRSAGELGPPQQVAGTYLRRRYGDRLVNILNSIRQGEIGCAGFKMEIKRASIASFDGLAGEAGKPLYLLDLRSAPPNVAAWLAREQQLGEDFVLQTRVGKAYDLLFYMDSVKPACAE